MNMVKIKAKTKVSKVQPNTLRITIPITVSDLLGLKEGDYVLWDFEVKNDKIKVFIEKDKKEGK